MLPSENQNSLIEKTKKGFIDHFSETPTHFVSAPGRLNVIGEHVDYSGGVVLPAAIERWITGCFRKNNSSEVRIYDLKYKEGAALDPNGDLKAEKGSWLNYPKGVFAQFQERGVEVPGFDVCLFSNIPTGGGLSSSAAFEALFATIVEELTNRKLDGMEKALLCQKAEHEYAGVPCGIMDQAAVILSQPGHLLKLDCADLNTEQVPLNDDSTALMIIDSNVHHELANGEYRKRREECEKAAEEMGVKWLRDVSSVQVEDFVFSDGVVARRAKHVVREIERTFLVIEAFRKGDYALAGKCIQQSHHSLQYRYEVSCPELDFIVSFCNAQNGVYGSRMMGGGFGGSAIVLVDKERAGAIAKDVESAYLESFGLEASVFLTNPSGGVRCEAF